MVKGGALFEVARRRKRREAGTEGRGIRKEYQMFAVLKTGGKQYRVQSGDVLRVEKLAAEEGATVEFEQVLLLGAGLAISAVASSRATNQSDQHSRE